MLNRSALSRQRMPPRQFLGPLVQTILITTLSVAIFGLVWLYASGLRDPRYLDGWILAGGMAFQLSFHVVLNSFRLSARSVRRWRAMHIFSGYVLIAAFVCHSNLTLPDTALEWALFAGFVIITFSGVLGTYLSWILRARRPIDDSITFTSIPERRLKIERRAQQAVAETEPATLQLDLPSPPHEDWIAELYSLHLHDFFRRPRNLGAHLLASQRPLQSLNEEIDKLSRYVDNSGQKKLDTIKEMVAEKDQLDFTRVYLGISKGWQLIHVPITYGLIVLTVFHIIVVYAFASGG